MSTLYLLVISADNFRKQFGPWSGSNLFDTQMVFLKEFFEKVCFVCAYKSMWAYKDKSGRYICWVVWPFAELYGTHICLQNGSFGWQKAVENGDGSIGDTQLSMVLCLSPHFSKAL